MTKKQAIKLYESKWWVDVSPEAIVSFQLFEKRLCMPFSDFHKAVEQCLHRAVFTHEFAFDGLKQEFLMEKEPPTFEQILDLIPKDKQAVFIVNRGEHE